MTFTNRQSFLSFLAQTSDDPVMLDIAEARGVHIIDSDGKSYIDLISGISVSCLGHGNPGIVEAIKAQADRHLHVMVYGEFIQAPQTELARKLIEQLPEPLERVFFVNSGSEAVEGALKAAKKYTGKTELIYFTNAYHGSTHGAMSVMGSEDLSAPFEPLLPNTKPIRFGIADDLSLISDETACVIVEPIQGEAGIVVPPRDYLQQLRQRCSDTGTILIVDEIQTGFGRTGSLFAFEEADIIPDILLLAKSLGGGMPLGAFISSDKIMSVLSQEPALGHITTFGGHPVSCAAGLAMFDQLVGSTIIAEISDKEALFRANLHHPRIKDIRGKGLLMALDFEDAELNKKVIGRCLHNGLLVDWFLFAETALRIAPPLTISNDEIRQACSIIIKSIEEA